MNTIFFETVQPVVHHVDSQALARPPGPVNRQGGDLIERALDIGFNY